jgi:hypothetical protein
METRGRTIDQIDAELNKPRASSERVPAT